MSQRFDRPKDDLRPSLDSSPRARHVRSESVGSRPHAAARHAAPSHVGASISSGAPDPNRTSRTSSSRRAGRVWRVVFWVALVVFVGAAVALGAIVWGYHQNREVYAELADRTFPEPVDATLIQLSDMTVDWDALRSINPDVVGWIYIPDSDVNYPIVHSGDDVYYLKTDFYGQTNWIVSFGTIFLSGDNATDFSDECNVIYGHHMNEGSMFSSLADWTDSASFNAHRSVYLLTPAGNYRLETFALDHVGGYEPFVQTSFGSPDERSLYVQEKIDRSMVVPDTAIPSASEIDKMFMLSTCDNLPSNGRYVLCCYVAESTVPGVSGCDPSGVAVDLEVVRDIGDAVAAS